MLARGWGIQLFRLLLVATCLLALWPVGLPVDAVRDGRQGWLQDMTVEQKVGQLFLLTIYSTTLNGVDRSLIADTLPGGVVLFPHNISEPQQVTQLTNALQHQARDIGAGVPLLVAVDQEGGRVRRLQDGFTPFPSVLLLGASGRRDDAANVGYAMGQEMGAVGINMNLAPVADLHSIALGESYDGVLYRRTFGAAPELVGRLAGGMVNGLQAAGVIGVVKHFPGHGAATQDSHSRLPQVDLPRPQVEETALAAFQAAIDSGAAAVMVGHLYYPALDPLKRPATLSPVVLGILREQMGFNGVVISDAMDMGAIMRDYDMSRAVIDAINAGVDLVTFGPHVTAQDQRVVIANTVQAVYSGAIPMARLDEAVGRLLALRARYGLLDWNPLDVATTGDRLRLDAHRHTLTEVAEHAITLLDNPAGLLPLDADRDQVALIFPAEYAAILDECRRHDPDAAWYAYSYNPPGADVAAAVALAEQVAVAVVFVEDIGRNDAQYQLVWSLPAEKTVAVALRSPYDWHDLPGPLATVLLTYASIPPAHSAACRVLYGVVPTQGRLPVPVGPYPVGAGVQIGGDQSARLP